jgi:hypothetical protein
MLQLAMAAGTMSLRNIDMVTLLMRRGTDTPHGEAERRGALMLSGRDLRSFRETS